MYEAGTIITLSAGAYSLQAPLAGSAYGVVWRAEGPPAIGEVALKLVNRAQMEGADASQRPRWLDSANAEIAFLGSLQPWSSATSCACSIAEAMTACRRWRSNFSTATSHITSQACARAARHRRSNAYWRGAPRSTRRSRRSTQYGWRYLDLKPANLLLDRDGKLRLTDFGTSRALSDMHAHPYTGTASWQAPEQFFPDSRGAFHTDARTDYFALGALLYFFASGGEPLRFCRDCGEAFRAHGSAAPARLRKRHDGSLPPTLAADEAARFLHQVELDAPGAGHETLALLRRLLAPRPEQRPRHALDISRVLDRIRGAIRQPMRKAA